MCSMGEERVVSHIFQREFKVCSVASGLLSAQATPRALACCPEQILGPPLNTTPVSSCS